MPYLTVSDLTKMPEHALWLQQQETQRLKSMGPAEKPLIMGCA